MREIINFLLLSSLGLGFLLLAIKRLVTGSGEKVSKLSDLDRLECQAPNP